MKKKTFLALLIGAILPLTSCTLFNDDDLKYENHYNPPISSEEADDENTNRVHGVKGVSSTVVEDCLAFKDVYYAEDGKIINTYKNGGVNHKTYDVNHNNDYEGDPDVNNYDLYIPNSVKKNEKHLVLLFIHGGAWVGGFKTDVNPYVFEFAERGYITATIKYTLLKEEMDDDSLSIFRNLDEIDACIKSIKTGLDSLGFDTTKTQLAIGGASSGSHLTMLYTYSRGQSSSIPIKFIMNAVGPVDIKPAAWKRFSSTGENDSVLDAGIDKDAIAAQAAASNIETLKISSQKSGENIYWNNYETMRIANGMCGLPYTVADVEAAALNEKTDIDMSKAVSISMTEAGGGEDQLSVSYWIKETNRVPIICAYGGKDGVVGINQYATLQTALDNAGYTSSNHKYVYFKKSEHAQISADYDEAAYTQLINYVNAWCEADSI